MCLHKTKPGETETDLRRLKRNWLNVDTRTEVVDFEPMKGLYVENDLVSEVAIVDPTFEDSCLEFNFGDILRNQRQKKKHQLKQSSTVKIVQNYLMK